MELVTHWAEVVIRAGLIAGWLMCLGRMLTAAGSTGFADLGERIPGDW